MHIEITIANEDASGRSYLTWAPVQGTVRHVGVDGGSYTAPVTVTLSNDNMEAGELATQLSGARAELERLRLQERNLGRQAERARALADIGAVPKKEFEQASAEQQGAQQTIKFQQSAVAD